MSTMHMKSAMHVSVVCALLGGLAACGELGSDSKIVEKCVADGGKKESCRCVDRVFRAEFTAEEYQKVEGLMTFNKKLEKLGPGDLQGLLELTSKEAGKGPKGLEATMAFYMKLASTSEKIMKTCTRA